jgi:AcrR family transcriptional regulator
VLFSELADIIEHQEGFDSVSMRRIVADIGMRAMSLYKYFANKNVILDHIWGEFIVKLFVKLFVGLQKECKLKT